MQTFLPYADFNRSASVLDNSRLCKQITEAMQIYNCLAVKPTRWSKHPAVLMWLGHTDALLSYANIMRNEFVYNRGGRYKEILSVTKAVMLPNWIGHDDIHSSHRGRLILKGYIDILQHRLKINVKTKQERIELIKSIGYKDVRYINFAQFNHINTILDDMNFKKSDRINHYLQFGWVEKPSNEYVWPI